MDEHSDGGSGLGGILEIRDEVRTQSARSLHLSSLTSSSSAVVLSRTTGAGRVREGSGGERTESGRDARTVCEAG